MWPAPGRGPARSPRRLRRAAPVRRRSDRHPHLGFPGDDASGGVEPGAHVEQLLRALRIPAMLVAPRPLHANGLPTVFDRSSASAATSSLPLRPYDPAPSRKIDPHLLRRQAEHPREVGANTVRALRRAPDGGAPVGAHIGDGAGRPKRRVGLERPEIRRRHRLRGALQAAGGSPRLTIDLIPIDRGPAGIAIERRVVRQSFPVGPRGLQRGGRAHRGPLVPRDDRKEVLDPDDARVGNATDRRLIHRDERRADRGWTNDSTVQHAGQGEVLDVDLTSGALGRERPAWAPASQWRCAATTA